MGLERPPDPWPQWQCATGRRPCTQKRVKKVNCFLKTEILFIWNHSFGSQIRLRMHLRVSRNPMASGGLQLPPVPWPQWHAVRNRWTACAPMAYGLGHPTSLKYTILSSIKDSRQVNFLSFFVLPYSNEK